MKVARALQGVTSILLDSAPAIYHLEENPAYAAVMKEFFRVRALQGITIVSTPITLAECLVHPYRLGMMELRESYHRLIVEGEGTEFWTIAAAEADAAAKVRSAHNLRLADALQVAIAGLAGCQAILTNDVEMKKAPGLRVLLVSELEP